jgi:flavodoxin
MQPGGVMNTLVIYDSKFGNTKRIAQIVANNLREFGQAREIHVSKMQPDQIREVDLVVFGCPTQGWGPSKDMHVFIGKIPAKNLKGMKAACFDTRFYKPTWMVGCAAGKMAKSLAKTGVEPVAPPESFFVKAQEGPLENGEQDRAAAWASSLGEKCRTEN